MKRLRSDWAGITTHTREVFCQEVLTHTLNPQLLKPTHVDDHAPAFSEVTT